MLVFVNNLKLIAVTIEYRTKFPEFNEIHTNHNILSFDIVYDLLRCGVLVFDSTPSVIYLKIRRFLRTRMNVYIISKEQNHRETFEMPLFPLQLVIEIKSRYISPH